MTEINLEPLKEVATIAAGNAATAIYKLIGEQVTVAVPSVKVVAVEQVTNEVGHSAELSVVGLVKIKGNADGLLLFTLDPSDAEQITKGIIDRQMNGNYADLEQGVLREMVNIVAGTALNAIGTFLNLQLMQSIPDTATDMLGALLDPFMAELGADYDKVLVLQELFTIPSKGVSLKQLAIIDPKSTSMMLERIAQKVQPGNAANS